MTRTRTRVAAVAIGVAIVGAHAAGFAALAARAHGVELSVELAAPLASPTLALDGRVPPALAPRVEIDDRNSVGPGLARRRWRTEYRGGFSREVGASQLVGPFQDPTPARLACSARVVIGQALLDEASPLVARELDRELRGTSAFGVGDYQRVTGVALRWTTRHPDDGDDFVGDAPHGYIRVTATIELDRVTIPVVVAMVPSLAGEQITLRTVAHAQLDFDNRVAQFVSDKLGGNRIATRLTNHELDGALISVLAPPPPFAVPGGGELRFLPCGAPLEIHDGRGSPAAGGAAGGQRGETDGAYAALPFGVAIARVAAAPSILPPRMGEGPRPAPRADTKVALDLDLDALNAILFELWRAGELDRALLRGDFHGRFNRDPLVTELLSIRISPLVLALPPVVRAAGDHLALAADARLAIADTQVQAPPVTARLYGELGFTFSPQLAPRVSLANLELACEQGVATLVPCYGDLVDAARGRAGDFDGALTTAFGSLLASIFVDRELGDRSLPAALAIHGATASVTLAPRNATLHLELAADLTPK